MMKKSTLLFLSLSLMLPEYGLAFTAYETPSVWMCQRQTNNKYVGRNIHLYQSTRTAHSVDYVDETENEAPDNEIFAANNMVSTSSSTTTMDDASVLTVTKGDGVLSLWKRRLITHEDPLSIHKWASLVYTLSSTVILGTAGVRGMTDMLHHSTTAAAAGNDPSSLFATMPDFLAPYAYAFFWSNVVMCVASVRMAFIHRQGDLIARNAFLGTAVSSLFSGFFFLWTSPYATNFFDSNDLVNQGPFALLCALNAYFIVDTVVQTPQVVEGRRDRKVEVLSEEDNASSSFRYWRDALGYVLPIAWGLPVIGSTGYQASWAHDRAWFMQYTQHITETTGFPFLASASYLQVLASLAASYGALFVTLRDKKLITKNQELVGITVFSVPAMLWTILTTVIFYQNLG